MMHKRSILLLHGFHSDSRSYFLPALRKRYETDHEVFSPDLPSPDSPHIDEWTKAIQSLGISHFDLIVAHSLGGALAWSMISRGLVRCNTLVTIGSSPSPKDNESMNTFLKYSLNFPVIRAATPHLFIVQSLDDPWNYPEDGLVALRHSLGTGLFYADKGHFEAEELPKDVLDYLDHSLLLDSK